PHEDLPPHPQPQFTQLDIQITFLHQQHIIPIPQHILPNVLKHLKPIHLTPPFPPITYPHPIHPFPSHKPHTPFPIQLINLSQL
uniref:amino acid--tRNA ligase-related protein n=1 Tax=Staphylococcus epidermidis TaxID=1282 RepID=UPI003F68A5AF